MNEFYKVKVFKNKQIADNVFIISFERKFNFKAGQVVKLSLENNSQHRLYSIASGENDEFIDILYDIKPDGYLTPKLQNLKKDDFLFCSNPFGNFLSTKETAFWIATGTGIAPFVSMTKSGFSENKTIIQGGRFLDSFYFSDYFDKTLNSNYIKCCSQQKSENSYFGRLTEYLNKIEYLNPEIKYFICGSAEMINEVRDILIEKSVKFKNIIAETYF